MKGEKEVNLIWVLFFIGIIIVFGTLVYYDREKYYASGYISGYVEGSRMNISNVKECMDLGITEGLTADEVIRRIKESSCDMGLFHRDSNEFDRMEKSLKGESSK